MQRLRRAAEFKLELAKPVGDEPILSQPAPEAHAQAEQIEGGVPQSPNIGTQRPEQQGGGLTDKIGEKLT